jgi:16S rRNA (guanine1207-N2)-methyltransferase
LCGDNAQALGLEEQVRAARPDDGPPELDFDEIWSNPPIRVGKQALHDLLLRWLPRLAPTGRALMVVGKNLGADSLQRWLVSQGYACDRLASAKGFRVLEIRPRDVSDAAG